MLQKCWVGTHAVPSSQGALTQGHKTHILNIHSNGTGSELWALQIQILYWLVLINTIFPKLHDKSCKELSCQDLPYIALWKATRSLANARVLNFLSTWAPKLPCPEGAPPVMNFLLDRDWRDGNWHSSLSHMEVKQYRGERILFWTWSWGPSCACVNMSLHSRVRDWGTTEMENLHLAFLCLSCGWW